MSLDLESQLKVFFASSPQNVRPIATLQISHSAMSQTFYLWREPYQGAITIEGAVEVDVMPANIEIKLAGSAGNLDQVFNIQLGLVDIEDVFRGELDRIPVDTSEKIHITYREYLSDDLTAIMSSGVLQAEAVSYVVGAATISAVSPRLNMTRTGELYASKAVPMLRGFL